MDILKVLAQWFGFLLLAAVLICIAIVLNLILDVVELIIDLWNRWRNRRK